MDTRQSGKAASGMKSGMKPIRNHSYAASKVSVAPFCAGHKQVQRKDDNENGADALVPSRLRQGTG